MTGTNETTISVSTFNATGGVAVKQLFPDIENMIANCATDILSCVQTGLSIVEQFDPIGLVSIAGAFIYPTCK